MPIPDLNPEGFLPVGVFECTLDEIRQKFGSFQGSDRRPKPFARFEDLVTAIRRSDLFEAILIDGSFVTEKAAPNDNSPQKSQPQPRREPEGNTGRF